MGRRSLVAALQHTVLRRTFQTSSEAGVLQRLPSFYESTIEEYAQREQHGMTLGQLKKFGKSRFADKDKATKRLLQSARFVQRELPIRLARRLMDLQALPHIFVTNPHISSVYESYWSAFEELRLLPESRTLDDEATLSSVLERLVEDHSAVITRLAIGLREVREKPIVGRMIDMDRFLDDMLTSRVARRILAENHIAFHRAVKAHHQEGGSDDDGDDDDFVGVVNTRLRVKAAIESAAEQATDACARALGEAPRIEVSCSDSLLLSYVPVHLHYVLVEVLKNSCRATVEQARNERGKLAPVEVRVRKDKAQGITNMLVLDEGSGLREDEVDRAFTYGWTTAIQPRPRQSSMLDAIGGDGGGVGTNAALLSGDEAPLAGLGFGLPMSRLYCRYFGGDLKVLPVGLGCGTAALIRFRHLSSDTQLYAPL
ncbi:mitochondrial branched-chain alpha-ketoacid dehydrogenase kinase [Pycnococcus provasolii]